MTENIEFDDFVKSILQQLSVAFEIPLEILMPRPNGYSFSYRQAAELREFKAFEEIKERWRKILRDHCLVKEGYMADHNFCLNCWSKLKEDGVRIYPSDHCHHMNLSWEEKPCPVCEEVKRVLRLGPNLRRKING